jgi:hypothetical protein
VLAVLGLGAARDALGAAPVGLGAGDEPAEGEPPLGATDGEAAPLVAGDSLGAADGAKLPLGSADGAALGSGAGVGMGVRKPPTPPSRP